MPTVPADAHHRHPPSRWPQGAGEVSKKNGSFGKICAIMTMVGSDFLGNRDIAFLRYMLYEHCYAFDQGR